MLRFRSTTPSGVGQGGRDRRIDAFFEQAKVAEVSSKQPIILISFTPMQAVRYHGANVALTVESIPRPTNLADNDVLIQVQAAALCHTELHFADGTLNLGVAPMTLGHEACGIVIQVGNSVPDTRIGERVILYYYVGCGSCRWCLQGDEQICGSLQAEFGFISDGGLAEYIKAPSRNAVPLPSNISFVDAAPIGCGVTTAVHASKIGRVQKDDWCLVYGVNGVGFGLIQLLKNHYGAKVIAATRSPARRKLALELGADVSIDTTDSSTVAKAVHQATYGAGADVIFECVGRRETMDACVGWDGALGKRGRLVLVGYEAGSEHEFRCHPIPMIVQEQSVCGSVGATLNDLKEALEYVSSGKVKTIVDSLLSLQDFQRGIDKIKSCDCIGKIVCRPAETSFG
jgi:propanol-preferring alcohol dehydrogenase